MTFSKDEALHILRSVLSQQRLTDALMFILPELISFLEGVHTIQSVSVVPAEDWERHQEQLKRHMLQGLAEYLQTAGAVTFVEETSDSDSKPVVTVKLTGKFFKAC